MGSVIITDFDYELHLPRPLESCFTNFIAGMKGFAANVDLQPVFNQQKCIKYVCSYFPKGETKRSQAIINNAKKKKTRETNVSIKDCCLLKFDKLKTVFQFKFKSRSS